jgi:hypothetical protein
MTRKARRDRNDGRVRPHRLAVYWTWVEEAPGERGCELMVPPGVLRLNATAAAIWERLDGRRDPSAVTASLARLYPGVAPGELAAAVARLLAQLEGLGAVVRRWSPLDPCPAARVTAPEAEPGRD